jgi:hypothetical protein
MSGAVEVCINLANVAKKHFKGLGAVGLAAEDISGAARLFVNLTDCFKLVVQEVLVFAVGNRRERIGLMELNAPVRPSPSGYSSGYPVQLFLLSQHSVPKSLPGTEQKMMWTAMCVSSSVP